MDPNTLPPLCGVAYGSAPFLRCQLDRGHDPEQIPHTTTWQWTASEEAPTQRLPPIRETVLRRPPPPTIRELTGSELLRALAAELDREDLAELDREDQEHNPEGHQ